MITDKIDENFVSYVLNTYDLPDKTKEKLEKTALFRLRDNEVTDFDEAYTYIDSLAMGTELRQHARIRSLDEEVGETKRTLHEIIGTEDENLKKLFENLQSRKKLSGQEVVECLSYRLDRQDTEVFSKLMEGQKMEFDISLDYLLDHAEEIGERIRQVAQRYERGGIILLPRRPIVQVSWDPFDVEFSRGRLTEEEKSAIKDLYIEFEGNATAIAKRINRNHNTVLNFLKKIGYKQNKVGRIRGGFTEEYIERWKRIVHTYQENQDVDRTGIELGLTPEIVKSFLYKAGIRI